MLGYLARRAPFIGVVVDLIIVESANADEDDWANSPHDWEDSPFYNQWNGGVVAE
jgi:hypothetical protein